MITITELELVLCIGFAVMTFLYFKARGEVSMHRRITGEIFMGIAKGEIKPLVDKVLPLSEGREGLRLIQDREVIGKVVITP